jgi:hypothetical protein
MKKKTTNIKDSYDLNITKHFTCKFWAWIKEKIWVTPPPELSLNTPLVYFRDIWMKTRNNNVKCLGDKRISQTLCVMSGKTDETMRMNR